MTKPFANSNAAVMFSSKVFFPSCNERKMRVHESNNVPWLGPPTMGCNSFPTSSRTRSQSMRGFIRSQLVTFSEIFVWSTMERLLATSLNRSSRYGLVSAPIQMMRQSGWSVLYLRQKSKASCVLLFLESEPFLIAIMKPEKSRQRIHSKKKTAAYPEPPSPQMIERPLAVSVLATSESRPSRSKLEFLRTVTRKLPMSICVFSQAQNLW